jgi:hypothetical protein
MKRTIGATWESDTSCCGGGDDTGAMQAPQ